MNGDKAKIKYLKKVRETLKAEFGESIIAETAKWGKPFQGMLESNDPVKLVNALTENNDGAILHTADPSQNQVMGTPFILPNGEEVPQSILMQAVARVLGNLVAQLQGISPIQAPAPQVSGEANVAVDATVVAADSEGTEGKEGAEGEQTSEAEPSSEEGDGEGEKVSPEAETKDGEDGEETQKVEPKTPEEEEADSDAAEAESDAEEASDDAAEAESDAKEVADDAKKAEADAVAAKSEEGGEEEKKEEPEDAFPDKKEDEEEEESEEDDEEEKKKKKVAESAKAEASKLTERGVTKFQITDVFSSDRTRLTELSTFIDKLKGMFAGVKMEISDSTENPTVSIRATSDNVIDNIKIAIDDAGYTLKESILSEDSGAMEKSTTVNAFAVAMQFESTKDFDVFSENVKKCNAVIHLEKPLLSEGLLTSRLFLLNNESFGAGSMMEAIKLMLENKDNELLGENTKALYLREGEYNFEGIEIPTIPFSRNTIAMANVTCESEDIAKQIESLIAGTTKIVTEGDKPILKILFAPDVSTKAAIASVVETLRKSKVDAKAVSARISEIEGIYEFQIKPAKEVVGEPVCVGVYEDASEDWANAIGTKAQVTKTTITFPAGVGINEAAKILEDAGNCPESMQLEMLEPVTSVDSILSETDKATQVVYSKAHEGAVTLNVIGFDEESVYECVNDLIKLAKVESSVKYNLIESNISDSKDETTRSENASGGHGLQKDYLVKSLAPKLSTVIAEAVSRIGTGELACSVKENKRKGMVEFIVTTRKLPTKEVIPVSIKITERERNSSQGKNNGYELLIDSVFLDGDIDALGILTFDEKRDAKDLGKQVEETLKSYFDATFLTSKSPNTTIQKGQSVSSKAQDALAKKFGVDVTLESKEDLLSKLATLRLDGSISFAEAESLAEQADLRLEFIKTMGNKVATVSEQLERFILKNPDNTKLKLAEVALKLLGKPSFVDALLGESEESPLAIIKTLANEDAQEIMDALRNLFGQTDCDEEEEAEPTETPETMTASEEEPEGFDVEFSDDFAEEGIEAGEKAVMTGRKLGNAVVHYEDREILVPSKILRVIGECSDLDDAVAAIMEGKDLASVAKLRMESKANRKSASEVPVGTIDEGNKLIAYLPDYSSFRNAFHTFKMSLAEDKFNVTLKEHKFVVDISDLPKKEVEVLSAIIEESNGKYEVSQAVAKPAADSLLEQMSIEDDDDAVEVGMELFDSMSQAKISRSALNDIVFSCVPKIEGLIGNLKGGNKTKKAIAKVKDSGEKIVESIRDLIGLINKTHDVYEVEYPEASATASKQAKQERKADEEVIEEPAEEETVVTKETETEVEVEEPAEEEVAEEETAEEEKATVEESLDESVALGKPSASKSYTISISAETKSESKKIFKVFKDYEKLGKYNVLTVWRNGDFIVLVMIRAKTGNNALHDVREGLDKAKIVTESVALEKRMPKVPSFVITLNGDSASELKKVSSAMSRDKHFADPRMKRDSLEVLVILADDKEDAIEHVNRILKKEKVKQLTVESATTLDEVTAHSTPSQFNGYNILLRSESKAEANRLLKELNKLSDTHGPVISAEMMGNGMNIRVAMSGRSADDVTNFLTRRISSAMIIGSASESVETAGVNEGEIVVSDNLSEPEGVSVWFMQNHDDKLFVKEAKKHKAVKKVDVVETDEEIRVQFKKRISDKDKKSVISDIASNAGLSISEAAKTEDPIQGIVESEHWSTIKGLLKGEGDVIPFRQISEKVGSVTGLEGRELISTINELRMKV